jgi:hypothetical protein
MNSMSFKASVWTLPLLLGMMLCLAGCSLMSTTRTNAIKADHAIVAGVCSVWLSISYLSTTDEQTKTEIRANNAARDAYCAAPNEGSK